MQLPMPLVRLRSALAQGLALGLRMCGPIRIRLMRFVYEIWGRSQIRGRVEPGVQFIGPITVEGSCNVDVGAGTRVGRRTFFKTEGDARIAIGRNVTINDGATLVAYSGITIGDNALIGEYVSIRDADHGTARHAPIRTQPHVSRPTSVGADAWIGRGACVLKGVRIGDGAVVGANSVVTKDVEPNTIVAGVPVRRIGVRLG